MKFLNGIHVDISMYILLSTIKYPSSLLRRVSGLLRLCLLVGNMSDIYGIFWVSTVEKLHNYT